jgi:hypothetical protein
MVSRTTYLRRLENRLQCEKGKERSRSQEKSDFGDLSLLYKQRDDGMGYAKEQRNAFSPSSFLFFFNCGCLEGRLKPGGPPSKRRAAPRLLRQHFS